MRRYAPPRGDPARRGNDYSVGLASYFEATPEMLGGAIVAAIRDAPAATKDFPAVTCVVTIDAEHDAVKPAVLLVLKGGRFEYVTTVQP